jgi:HEPN domain-containing protein
MRGKILKGFLTSKNVSPPKTHDLTELCELASEQGLNVSDLLDPCYRLFAYAVETRYPGGDDISDSEADLAIQDTIKIYDAIRDIIYSEAN